MTPCFQTSYLCSAGAGPTALEGQVLSAATGACLMRRSSAEEATVCPLTICSASGVVHTRCKDDLKAHADVHRCALSTQGKAQVQRQVGGAKQLLAPARRQLLVTRSPKPSHSGETEAGRGSSGAPAARAGAPPAACARRPRRAGWHYAAGALRCAAVSVLYAAPLHPPTGGHRRPAS